MKNILNILKITLLLSSFILVFILAELWMQLAVFSVFLILSLISAKRLDILKMFTSLAFLLIFTLIVHLFFRFGENNYWQGFSEWALWNKTLFFTFRNANILLIMSYFIKSQDNLNIHKLTAFLENRKPSKLFQPLSLAMRYTGLISEEFTSIQQVHRILGIKKPKHLIAQVKYYASLIIPTIISSLERAEHLSIAMTSRGYNRGS
ncbi:MAG: energy-coupling factor transporter transmembrane component T [Candidatus Neomarinimicrobiota bacterium]|jgi:energy-coupling factor transporter transmembrane protein EcfT